MNSKQIILSATAAVFMAMGCNSDDDSNGSGNGNGSENDDVTYAVGDVGPAGGLIFFVDTENRHDDWTYLELAPSDWSESGQDPNSTYVMRQGAFPSINTNAMIGTGVFNTEILLEVEKTFYGLDLCVNYSVEFNNETYDDWFFPSRYELEEAYQALHSNEEAGFRTEPNFGMFDDRVMYQSSTVTNGSVWLVNFFVSEDGSDRNVDMFGTGAYDTRGYVRPVRRF